MPAIVALLLAFGFRQSSVKFKIAHHVHLEYGVLSTYEARRDGSVVGSYGQMGLHDGFELPLIVIKGKQIVLSNERDLNSHQVAAILPSNRFAVLTDYRAPRLGVLSGKKLMLGAPIPSAKAQSEVEPTKSPTSPEIDGVFPVPEGMRDTTANENVDLYKYLEGTKLMQVNTLTHMEYGYRGALIDASGRVWPLEKCIPGMARYQVRGIQFVSPDGWFVIDAIKDPPAHENGVRIGFGDELFWIEALRDSGSGK